MPNPPFKIFAVLMIGLLFACLGGCSFLHASHSATSGVTSTLTKAQAKAQAEQAANHATVDDAAGKASPVIHPIKSVNRSVKEDLVTLGWTFKLSILVLIIGAGLLFTPFRSFSKPAVCFGGAGVIVSLMGQIVIPFAPAFVAAFFSAGIAFGIYELIKHRKQVAADAENYFTDFSKLNLGNLPAGILESSPAATVTAEVSQTIAQVAHAVGLTAADQTLAPPVGTTSSTPAK